MSGRPGLRSEEAPSEGEGEAGPGRSPTRGFDEAADEATLAVDITEEAVVAPMTPIRSAGGGGSVRSVSETPGDSEDVGRRSPIVSTGSRGEVSVAVGRTSVAHISLLLPIVNNLLFSRDGIDDLNVDNVDRPLGLPAADAPILFGSFFDLVSPGRAERSPSSNHRASSSGEGALKGTDAVSGREAEPVAPVEGGAVEAVVPDSEEGSGGNSSMGQHVPIRNDHHVAVGGGSSRREGSRGSSSGPTASLDINVEFVEPFWQLVSSCSIRLQK
ncbi:hypothetical protein ACLOJK_036324, partial [Asimina triloba]